MEIPERRRDQDPIERLREAVYKINPVTLVRTELGYAAAMVLAAIDRGEIWNSREPMTRFMGWPVHALQRVLDAIETRRLPSEHGELPDKILQRLLEPNAPPQTEYKPAIF